MADAGLFGPFTPTVGQPFKVPLPPDINRIDVQNDSAYDLWIYFGNVAPNDPTNANNTWHRAVRRGHNGVISVYGPRGANARERSPNAWAAFQGTIWVMAVNPGALALTGTQSGRNQVYITPLFPGDPSPVHSALATQVDVSSQSRTIHVPVTPTQTYAGASDFTAVGQTNTLFPSPFLIAPTGQTTWDGTQNVQVYLYFAHLALAGFNTTALWADVALLVAELNASFVVTTTHTIHAATMLINQTNGTGHDHSFTPAFPQSLQFQPAATTAYLALQINYAHGGAASVRVNYNIGIDGDNRNQQVVPSIGGGLTGLVGPTGSAPLF